jgi:hypothetical protein
MLEYPIAKETHTNAYQRYSLSLEAERKYRKKKNRAITSDTTSAAWTRWTLKRFRAKTMRDIEAWSPRNRSPRGLVSVLGKASIARRLGSPGGLRT